MKRLSSVLIVIGLLSSCGSKLGYKEYFNYYNSFQPGSYLEKKVNGVLYQLQFRTPEFQALTSLKGQTDLTLFEERKKEFDQGYNFCLRISSETHEDILRKFTQTDQEYYDRIEQIAINFSKMIKGVTTSDTLYCQFHHFERSYNVRPFIQILFSLKQTEEIPDEVVFQDEIFNKESIIFKDFKSYYSGLPQLQL